MSPFTAVVLLVWLFGFSFSVASGKYRNPNRVKEETLWYCSYCFLAIFWPIALIIAIGINLIPPNGDDP